MTKLPPELKKIRDDRVEECPPGECRTYLVEGFNTCYEAMQLVCDKNDHILAITYEKQTKDQVDEDLKYCQSLDDQRADAWVTRTGNIGTTARQIFFDGLAEGKAIIINEINQSLADAHLISADKHDAIMEAGFDHPCRETCSGWEQGRDRGMLEERARQQTIETWYGRIVFTREGIVTEREFSSKELAEAYALGANDMKDQSDLDEDGVLEDFVGCTSNVEAEHE